MADTDKIQQIENLVKSKKANAEQVYNEASNAEQGYDFEQRMAEMRARVQKSSQAQPQRTETVTQPKAETPPAQPVAQGQQPQRQPQPQQQQSVEQVETVPPNAVAHEDKSGSKFYNYNIPAEDIESDIAELQRLNKGGVDYVEGKGTYEFWPSGSAKDSTASPLWNSVVDNLYEMGKDMHRYPGVRSITTPEGTRYTFGLDGERTGVEYREDYSLVKPRFVGSRANELEVDENLQGRIGLPIPQKYDTAVSRAYQSGKWKTLEGDVTDYSGYSDAQLREEYNRLMSGASGLDDNKAALEAGNVYDELVSHSIGFSNAKEMNSNKGTRDLRLMGERINSTYPSEIYSSYLQQALQTGQVGDVPDVFQIIDGMVGDQLSGDLDNMGESEVAPIRRINDALKNEVFMKHYPTWALLNAAKKNISYEQSWNEGIEAFADKWQSRVSDLKQEISSNMKQEAESFSSDHPIMYTAVSAVDKSIIAKLIVSGVNIIERSADPTAAKRQRYYDTFVSQADMHAGYQVILPMAIGMFLDTPAFGVGGKVANWGTVKLVGKEMLGSELANTTSSMINLGLFGLAGQASDDIYRRQFSGWNYATGLGKSILSGGVLAKMGAVTRRGLFSAATKRGRFGNDTYRFLGEYLGFAGTDIVAGIASGEVRHMSDVYKILAESGATLGTIKAAHIGQGQSYEKGERAAKALEGKYGNLAKAVRENNNKASRGETILSLRDEDALRDWVRLNQDLLNGTAGVTWEDVKSVSALIGEECSTPIPSSTRMVKDNGAVRVQVLDGAGNVIRERSFSEKKAKKAETFQGECDELISWAAERDNESRYVMGLASENVYNVARDIAESRNEGNEVSPTLPDGTPNPDFFCTIPETVVEEYYTAKNTPEEKRSAEQQRFVEEFDKALAEVGDPALEPGSVRTKVCEQFGITEEQFKEQWEKSPKERDRKSKAAQAIIAYNKIMAGGHVLRRGKPIGEAVLDDGSTIRVINKVDVAEQLPADESAMIMYLAEDGTVQAVSAKRVTKIEYEENPIEAAQDERYKLSAENSQRVIDELRENVSNMIKDFSVEDLEAELKALNEEAQSNPEVASRNRLIAAIVEDALEKKRNGQDQRPQEESADVVIDGEGNVVETEQPGTGNQEQTGRLVIDDSKYDENDVMTREELQAGADFLNGEMDAREFAHRIGWDDEYISGFSEEELKNTARTIAEGMRGYLKVEEPKKEETPPVVQAGTEPEGIVVDGNGAVVEPAPAASKETPSRDERVEKLLDAMGFEKKEERDEQRAFYADKNNEEQFEKDYNAFVGKKTETVDDSQQEVKAVDPLDEPMPKDNKGKVAMRKASTRRTRKYLYEDLGLSKEDADSIVDYELEKATKAQQEYEKATKRPTIRDKGIDGDPEKLKQKLDEYDAAAKTAQDDVRYWEEVKRMGEEPAEPESKPESKPEPSAQNAGEANTVGNEVKEKWNNAPKVYGKSDTMRLENGTKLNGRYVLAPSGSASASHDANSNYSQTPGFPVDANGNTANSRDYRGNASYRQTTERHGENYNENAIQDRVVVSKDGVVLSGNGRTMAGELAARHNTDKEYVDYLREHAEDFGFTKEQVDSMEHPRVLFEVQEDLPYTAETFDMFNKGKEKVENKTETAVRLGKTTPPETISRVLEIIDQFDNIGDFNNNNQAPIDVLRELASAGVITQNEINALMENGKLSPQGKDFIENLLVGNIFASDPDAVRILSNNADVRQKVVTGLSALTSNARLGGGYSLVDEITTAIKLIANEREGNLERGSTMQAITTSFDFGEDYGSTPTEAFTNQLVITLTEMLNGKRVREFKEFLDSYNNEAEVSAGGEIRMFGNLGTKEEIFNFIIDNFKNGRYKKSRDARAGAGQGEGERAGNEEAGAGPENPRADAGQEVGGQAVTAAELEKAFNDSADEMSRIEQEWDDRIKNYIGEKYPTQATTSAATDSLEGKAERALMQADPEYKRLLEEQKRALDEAKKKNDDAYNAWQEALKKEGSTKGTDKGPEADRNTFPAINNAEEAMSHIKDIAKQISEWYGDSDEDWRSSFYWDKNKPLSEKIKDAEFFFYEMSGPGDETWEKFLYKEDGNSEELTKEGEAFMKELVSYLDREIPKVVERIKEAAAEREKAKEEEERAAQEKSREINKPLIDAKAKLLDAYKSGDKKAIRGAQKEMTEALPLAAEKMATEFGFNPTEIVESTIKQMVETRKKAEKGSAEYKTADYIVKALRKYQKDGVKSSEGRVELNAVTLKDPVSRDYLNEIMEKEGWGEEERKEFMRMLDDAADVVLEMGKRFPRLDDWNKREIASDKEGEIYKTMWRILNKKGQWIPNRSAFKKNGEYPWNIDLGTLCTKRESFDALVQLITEKGLAQNLGPTQIEGIKELLKSNGFLTACDICFNETKRARVISYANQVSNNWRVISEALGIKDKMVGDPIELTPEQTAILEQMAGRGYKSAFNKYIPEDQRREYKGEEKAGNEIDLGLTPSMMRKIAKQMLLDPTLTGKLKPETLITTEGMDWLLRTYGGHTKINELLASAWGSGTPKPIEGFNIYDPLSWREQYDQNKPGTKKRPEIGWFFNNGGFRAQSFTDYHPMLFLDYLQMFTDLGIRRLPIHIYTKVPALIKLFGVSGAKINMSLVPKMVDGVDAAHAGLKPDGKGGWEYAWDTDSFPIEEAFALRQDPRYGGNVGTIAVGLSDAHIRMMLADPTIDQVIPYHKSGMPESVQIKTGLKNATDYTDVQTTGNKPKGVKDFNFNEAVRKYGDPRRAAEEYVKWCEKNGYTPKFEQFKDDPNYYKLLADFRLFDGEGRYSEQKAVNPRNILQEGWETELENSLTDKTMQEQVKAQVGSNENLMKGVERLLGKQRMDGAVREEMVAKLKGALGKDNVESLKQNDFFDALEDAYSKTMGAEKAHEKVEVLRTNDGVVYGFAQGGKIVLNENVFNAETPIHEFTHIWVKVAQRENPKLWKKGKELLKQSEEWKEVMEDELYKDIHGDEDAVASEVLSRIVGRDGADYVRRLLDPEDKQLKRGGVYNKIREWLNDLFKSVRSLFAPSIRNLSYEEFTKMPLKTLFDEAEAKRFLEAKNRLEKEGTLESDVEEMGFDDGGVELMLVEDPKEIERLDKEPKAIGYRNVVLNEDGTLGSPMANRLGKTGVGRRPTAPFEFNRWERSDENPDLANDKGKIDLIKPDGKPVNSVDYNPYIHIRPTTVNKQFKQAWERDNLVYIKTEYPSSELNGEYQAEKAAKPVGKHPWGGGELILSRWDKPVEVVPWEEVADAWVKEFKDRGVEFDIVPPKLLPILMERGVEILPPHKGMGKACNDAYREKVLGERADVETDTKGVTGVKNDENYWRSDRKDVPLRERTRKSYTKKDGTYVEGLEDELQRLESELQKTEEETSEIVSQREDLRPRLQDDEKERGRGQNSLTDEPQKILSLRNRIALIRRELALRDSRSKEYKEKYGIADNGDISIENVAKMFHDFNSDKAVGELFEKVYNVLSALKNDFRVSDNVSPKYRGQAAEFMKMAFYNWDALVRGRDPQEKARTLLHEMIHNAATHVVSSYEDPVLRFFLSPKQRSAAKSLLDIFERIKDKGLRNSKGERFYGLSSANEMVSELANPEFREALKNVEYNHRSLWQRAKDALKKLFGLDVPTQGSNALDEASKALDKILDSYGVVTTAIRNAPRMVYDTINRLKGKNSVDEVDSSLNKNSIPHNIEGEEESGLDSYSRDTTRDYAAEMRELMRRRLRGEDVTAELEQLRADRRAAEAARNAGSNGAGSGEPPVEPPTPSAPATPEPAPELPPTGYDRPMSPIEMAQEAAIKAVADTKASLEQRNTARRELDASLKNIHKAMRLQKEYDRATVENVVSLCKMMVQSGLIDRRYISNLTPLFTKLKDSTGKEDLTSTVNSIMDVMLKSQERSIRNELNTLLNTKAQRINQSGVVTQGGVDIRGQRTLQSLNENFGKSVEDIDRRITQLEDLRGRIPENSEERLNEVDDKIQGALLAKAYIETAKNHEDNITAAEEELAEIKAQYKGGELGLKEYTEQKHALEAQIRSYRMSHADAMWDYVNTMRGIVAEGRSRAKDFIEAQKAHKNEIRHNAYSDMAGTPQYTQSRPGGLAKAVNSSVSQFVSSSLYTLDTMLRQLGHKHANGEGYLYERFGRGWLEARDREIRDYWADREELDKKAQELFGVKHFANLIDAIRKMPKMEVPYKDGGDIINHTLDQAQLMYIYMVNKMEDGIVKLRRMGISEEDVETIKNFMNPKLVELADWLQDDFLPSRREGYNEVHRRMFGADMDMVENYVPLRIDKGNLTETVDINNGQNEPSLASTVTGGIIKRTHNTTPIDIMGTNAIDMILDHLDEMNHWKNFAEWNRDVNTLLSDKTFRNKVKNTTTIYGSGDKLWKHLKDVFFIAGGTYKPKGEGIDKAMVNIAKGVSAAKVSFRVFTATKQLLSLPVFAANCNVGYMVKNMAKPAGSWNWCMENLPSFKHRWSSRIAGDTRLEDTDIDWKYQHKKWVEKAGKWGLTPNAFVDAMTVAVGARSVYEQRYKRYRKDGYDDVAADRRARQDATAAFNQTQQSSEKMFVAPMQVDRTLLAVGASLFRNASMGYERQFVEGLRNLKHLMGKERVVDEDGNVSTVSYKKASIEFMKKQMVRNGLTDTQAETAAKRIYNRSIWRNALKLAMFGFGAQMAWNVGGKLPYLAAQGYNAIMGDDDERKQAGANAWDSTKEAWWHAVAGGWLEGLPFGNVVSDGINNEINGENFFKFSPDLLPFFGDTEDVANHFDGKNKLRGATDLVNLGAQMFIGVNPQTFLDIMTGIVDITAGKKQSQADFGTAKEALLLTMRIMQCPQSQLDQLYIDELGMNARQAQNLTPEQVARRYAFYKAHHDVPYLWHLYNQEKQDELIKQYEKNFNKKLNEDVKKAGGTSDDYFELMNTSETNKQHDDYKNKAIADLVAKKDLPGIMAAWEKETDWNVKESLMKAYQKLKYGKEQMPSKADEAYEAKNGEDLKKKAEKIGRDLGFEAQDSFFQMSKVKTENKADKNQVVKDFRAAGGKFKYSKDGEYYDINDYEIDYPKKDKAKQAKCLSVVNAHKDELKRIYRNGWRYSRIDFLYKQIEAEGLKKAGGEEYDRDKMVEGFKEIINILNDEMQDIHEKRK